MTFWDRAWRFSGSFIGIVGGFGTIVGTATDNDTMFVKAMLMVLFAGIYHPEMRR